VAANFEIAYQTRLQNAGGRVFNYLLKRWEPLIQSLHLPGEQCAEQASNIILIQRLQKNCLFILRQRTLRLCGDVLTSLIETCRSACLNPLDYPGALMENRSAVFGDPGA
jgi:hypothetical protein